MTRVKCTAAVIFAGTTGTEGSRTKARSLDHPEGGTAEVTASASPSRYANSRVGSRPERNSVTAAVCSCVMIGGEGVRGGVRAGELGRVDARAATTNARERSRGAGVARTLGFHAASTSKPSTFTLLLHQSMQ